MFVFSWTMSYSVGRRGGVLAQPIEPTADEWDAIDTVAAAAELAGAGAFDDVL